MKGFARTLWVLAVTCCLSVGAVWGDILNGDFSSGLDDWNVMLEVDQNYPDNGVVEVVSGELHLKAVNNYPWVDPPGEWQRTESVMTWMTIDQLGTAPFGKDAFQFDASVTITGAPVSSEATAEAYVLVIVFYNDFAASKSKRFYVTENSPNCTLPMPDLVGGLLFNVVISAQSGLDETNAVPGEDYGITVEGYLDNFAFIPEPATMVLFVAGGAVLLRPRRSR